MTTGRDIKRQHRAAILLEREINKMLRDVYDIRRNDHHPVSWSSGTATTTFEYRRKGTNQVVPEEEFEKAKAALKDIMTKTTGTELLVYLTGTDAVARTLAEKRLKQIRGKT